jgi:sulfite reductase beta subunit-like hemoprotein
MNEPVSFPCEAIPQHGPHARLLGIYPQCQEGRFLQRVRVPIGVPSSAQWRALADIAEKFTPGTPLHLTTRQDVEIHDLNAQSLPLAQKALAEAGLSGFASAGDTLRNITLCPCSGSCSGRPDLQPLAATIDRSLRQLDGLYTLPRKFKISLSACPKACAQPYINDLGFVAMPGGRFLVTVAGSLGARPGTGVVLREDLPPGEVLPLVSATVKFFAAHGDREHRGTARLRYVRQRMGDEPFLTQLREAIAKETAAGDWPAVQIPTVEGNRGAKLSLVFANGDVTPEAAKALAELAADESLSVRIAIHHRVVVFGPDKPSIQARIDSFPALRQAASPQATVTACPGNRWCSHGLVSTNALADRLRAELGDRLAGKMVCVSGCPNGCAHSAVAEIGLHGSRSTIDGKTVETFTLWRGGGKGRTAVLATQVATKLTQDEVVKQVANGIGD